MIHCIEVICIRYAQNVMYSTPACALAKSPKKICPKFFKMSGRKIFEDCIIWISYHWLLQWKSAEKFPFQIQLVLGQKVYLFNRRKNKQNDLQYICNFFPHHTRQLKFGLPIDVPCAERSKSEIRVILNTIKLNTSWKKYLGLWENSI